MAKGKKTGGRDIKPGEVLNPHGRPPDPPGLKALKNLNAMAFETLLNEIMQMTQAELQAVQADPSTPSTKLALASIMIETINTGDQSRLEFFLKRKKGIGPVIPTLEGPDGEVMSFIGLVALATKKD